MIRRIQDHGPLSRSSRTRIRFFLALTSMLLPLAALIALEPPGANAAGSVVVNDLGDTTNPCAVTGLGSPCTLRDAITYGNAQITAVNVTFSLSGTITLSSTLPAISNTLGITLDGTGHNITVSGNNSVRVMVVNSGKILTLQSLTIANGACNDCSGAGIYNNGTLNVVNSSVSNNSITCSTGCTGAGISNNGTLNVSNSSLYTNTLTTCFGSCFVYGGGIYNSGTLSVSNTTLSNNSLTGTGTFGGGIYNIGLVTVTNSTLTNNSSSYRGGGIHNDGTARVTNSTYIGNSAGMGGALADSGNLFLSNSTLSGNSATSGGGIGNSGGNTRVINSTIAGNSTAGGQGAGIYIINGGATTITNTIVANSSPGANCNGSAVADGGHNVSYSDGSCPGVNKDPRLFALANYGGPTQTMALQVGSPALEAGDDAACASALVNNRDQRGAVRPWGLHCDIGAYESSMQFGPNYIVNVLGDTDDSSCDQLGQGFGNKDCTLREAIQAANAFSGTANITFSVSGIITLTSTLPALNNANGVTLDGTGQSVKVDGNNSFQVLFVNSGKKLTLNALTIADGYCYLCSGIGASGGGLFINSGATVTITRSTFSNNGAHCFGSGCNGGVGVGGGAIFVTGTTTVTIANSTFSGNNASCSPNSCPAWGGALWMNSSAQVTIANSTFSGNSIAAGFSGPAFGGAIANTGGTLTLLNSTISGNSAGSYSSYGGLANGGGTLNIVNTIIANSTVGDCYNSGILGTNNNNLIKGDLGYACGMTNGTNGNIIGVDPYLGALGNNGGLTQTMALLLGSPAMDKGDDATCAAAPVNNRDQRGAARPAGQHCDIGAFEARYLVFPLILK